MALSKLQIGLIVVMLVMGATVLEVHKRVERQASKPDTITHQSSANSSLGLAVTDLSDIQKLVGFKDNVFVGIVEGQLSYRMVGAAPEIRYAVRVMTNIKGNLKGSIVILVGPGRDNSLQVGATYILAARYNEENDLYAMGAAAYDRRLIVDDVDLTDAQLLALAEANSSVREFRVAYVNEIPYSGQIAVRRSYNAYATRCLDANGELIDETVEIAKERKGQTRAECVTRLTPEEPPLMGESRPTQATTPGPTGTPRPQPSEAAQPPPPPPVPAI